MADGKYDGDLDSPRAQCAYRLFDAGVLNALLGGHKSIGSKHNSHLCLLINEIYAQYEYAGKIKPSLYYYKTRGGAELDFVLKTKDKMIGIECMSGVDVSAYRLRGMKSFLKKYPHAKGYIIAPVQTGYEIDKNIFVIPWHAIA